jgi:hypothetical protein
VDPVTVTSTTTTVSPISASIPTVFNFDSLKNHRNFKLINNPRCGPQYVKKITGGIEADLGEFPWM